MRKLIVVIIWLALCGLTWASVETEYVYLQYDVDSVSDIDDDVKIYRDASGNMVMWDKATSATLADLAGGISSETLYNTTLDGLYLELATTTPIQVVNGGVNFTSETQLLDDCTIGNLSGNRVTVGGKLYGKQDDHIYVEGGHTLGYNTNYCIKFNSIAGNSLQFYDSGDLIFSTDTDGITVVDQINGATLNTGQGDNELYAMDQDVQTGDSVQFTTLTLLNTAGKADRISNGGMRDDPHEIPNSHDVITSIGAATLTESDTLDDVTDRGNATTNDITVNGLVVNDHIQIADGKHLGTSDVSPSQYITFSSGTGIILKADTGEKIQLESSLRVNANIEAEFSIVNDGGDTLDLDDGVEINSSQADKDTIINGSGAEVMRIDAGNGRVGIGTSSPANELEVSGTGQFDVLFVNRSAGSGWNVAADQDVWLKLDDNAANTNVTDSEGNYSGIETYSGNTSSLSISGLVDEAFEFDGAECIVFGSTNPSAFETGSWSISFWIKPDDGQPSSLESLCGYTFYNGGIPDQWITVRLLSNGRVQASMDDNFATDYVESTDSSDVAFDDDAASEWSHVAVVFDNSANTLEVFVNGESNGSSSSDFDPTDFYPSGPFGVGASFDGDTSDFVEFYDGDMDDWRFFDAPLTDAEIQGLYVSGGSGEALESDDYELEVNGQGLFSDDIITEGEFLSASDPRKKINVKKSKPTTLTARNKFDTLSNARIEYNLKSHAYKTKIERKAFEIEVPYKEPIWDDKKTTVTGYTKKTTTTVKYRDVLTTEMVRNLDEIPLVQGFDAEAAPPEIVRTENGGLYVSLTATDALLADMVGVLDEEIQALEARVARLEENSGPAQKASLPNAESPALLAIVGLIGGLVLLSVRKKGDRT